MEQLIILAVLVILSSLHGWWKKRQEQAEAEAANQNPQTPPPVLRRPTSPADNLEEQIRRLLQGEQPAQPPRPAAPPPLPRPTPPRLPVTPRAAPRVESPAAPRMSSLEESAQAFLRASQLESKVAQHMQRVDQLVTTHPKLEVKKKVTPEIRQALTLLRNRQSQRAAIIAGIVLGPPKALES